MDIVLIEGQIKPVFWVGEIMFSAPKENLEGVIGALF